MIIPEFVHTHVHDEMSILDSIGTADQYCETAVKLGYKAIAITNHGNINSFIKFQKASVKHGIKVLFGCEIYIVENIDDHPKKERRGHLCLWVKDDIGFRNLLKILDFSNIHGFYRRPRCSFEFLLNNLDGLIVGSACTSSFINLENGIQLLEDIIKKIPDDIYLEIMPHNMESQREHNSKCVELSRKYNIPLLLSHDCHYVTKQMARSQEVLLCMQSNDKMSNKDRWKFDIEDLYLCEPEYILEKIKEQGVVSEKDYLEAMANTVKLASKCKFKLEKLEMSLPIPPQFEGMDEEIIFRELCLNGLKKRFKDGDIPENYLQRFETEYEVIKEKGFIRYFLIVHDIIVWAKEKKIMFGPRGSAAGCLISYALQIVDIDPVANLLIFERFLNKSRNSPPDIDIDIEKDKRYLIIERLKTIYGEERVCNVSTFLKMEARGIIKDVSRVYEIPLNEVNEFTKTIDTTIEDAIEETKTGKDFYAKYKECVDVALSLQGQVKALGKHAGGIVISPERFDNGRAHLINRSGVSLVNWDKDDAEYMGLIKFDFLGLATWGVISETLGLIKQNHKEDIDLYEINLEDTKVYDELNSGNTVGVFQVNTYVLKRLIKDMGVYNINQLSDALAGCRPGPLETTTAEYVRRKRGGEWEPTNPIFDEVTKDTYNVCIYQEQIMFILNKVAGFSMSQCDDIRRVISKKRDKEYFAPFKKMFIDGCAEVGAFSQEEAEKWFENLLHFSRYGFNRSHSLSYAYVCYFTGWLKLHYPLEFLAANLSYGNESKENLVREAQRIGLQIIPPRIGVSHTKNWVVKENKLFVPFIECQGIGPKMIGTIQEYMDSCKSGFFSDTDKPIIKGKLKTILDDIGAFDNTLTENIDNYFDLGIAFNPKKMYPKLYKLLGQNEKANINDLLCGNIKDRNLVKLVKKKSIKELTQCNLCDIRKEAKAPVPMTFGMYNILILDEYPSWVEDKHGKAMVGDAAEKMLFPMLKEYGYEKDDFCLSSLVKCKCKNPELGVVKNCSKWLKREIERTEAFMVLAFGNTGIKMFKGEESGIQRANGVCEWNEEFGVYVVYCSSPVAALFHVDSLEKFKEGIKMFNQKLIDLGGFE